MGFDDIPGQRKEKTPTEVLRDRLLTDMKILERNISEAASSNGGDFMRASIKLDEIRGKLEALKDQWRKEHKK